MAGAGILFAGGHFVYTFGVFVKPLIYKFGWSRAAISGCVTLRSVVSAVAGPTAGTLSDKYGPKRFILMGICFAGLGYLLSSQITSLWQLYLFFGFLPGIGTMFFLIPLVSTVTRWFGGRSALANGVLMSGFGWGQMLVPPLATYLLLQYGWGTCLIVLGTIALVLGTVAWHFIRTPSATESQVMARLGAEGISKGGGAPTGIEEGYSLSEAVHTSNFLVMLLILMVVSACSQMILVHIVPAAIDTGITAEAAAIILTLSGITNTLGRLTLGGLASKIGNKRVIISCLAVQILVLLLLSRAESLYAFYVVAVVYGLAYGGMFPVVPTLASSFFGTKAIGAIYGAINTAYTCGGAIGPLLAGYIFDVTDSYFTIFSVCFVIGIAGFIFAALLTPIKGELAKTISF